MELIIVLKSVLVDIVDIETDDSPESNNDKRPFFVVFRDSLTKL